MKLLKQPLGILAALIMPTLLPWLVILLQPVLGLSPGLYAVTIFLALPFLWLVCFIAIHPCDLFWMAAGFGLSLILLGLVGGGWWQFGLRVTLSTLGPYSLPWCTLSLVIARNMKKKESACTKQQ